MITWIDFETSFIVDDRKNKDPSCYVPDNYLVSVGWDNEQDGPNYIFFNHKDLEQSIETRERDYSNFQRVLDKTTLLVAHNAKFELQWLRAAGFNYTGKIACTMIRSYVLAKAQKLPVGLAESCLRAGVANKKSELVDAYMRRNEGFEIIPMDVVEEYGRGDVQSCKELYYWQLEELDKQDHLWPTVELMEEFCETLTDIEDNGIKIDVVELDRLELEYQTELNNIKLELQDIIKDVMGATPINIDSPEQLSWVLYSRRVTDKHKWKEVFNLGSELRGAVMKPKRRPKMSTSEFTTNVLAYTEVLYKTVAEQCPECLGKGFIQKVKKDGNNYRRVSTCLLCKGSGIQYFKAGSIAGFKLIPRSAEEAAVGGFSTGSEDLERLKEGASGTSRLFLEKLSKANSISSYLSMFVNGIRRGLRYNNILHTSFMQTVVATGRLGSRNPNLQNLPRYNTFPVRKVVISRFPGGKILEADFSQLEFRVAGILSGNKQIKEDILNKIDVHANTAIQMECDRQSAKSDTFAPLYGARPEGKSGLRAKYYKFFIDRYSLDEWGWEEEVLANNNSYRLPSGRELCFPNAQRMRNGKISHSTQIKNYRVQGFATGDLVPIAVVYIQGLFKQYQLKSLLILTVHDSIEVDVYPDELDIVIKLVNEGMGCLFEECKRRYNYELTIPIDWDIKLGDNWLQMKDI